MNQPSASNRKGIILTVGSGTQDFLLDAAFIATLQKRQCLMVPCPEDLAYHQEWITADDILKLVAPLKKNACGQYLEKILTDRI